MKFFLLINKIVTGKLTKGESVEPCIDSIGMPCLDLLGKWYKWGSLLWNSVNFRFFWVPIKLGFFILTLIHVFNVQYLLFNFLYDSFLFISSLISLWYCMMSVIPTAFFLSAGRNLMSVSSEYKKCPYDDVSFIDILSGFSYRIFDT